VGLLGLSRWGVPLAAWLWWGWGLLTALWSLAPGHTLVASLWEVWALAALGAGRWRAGVLVLLGLLLLEGVYTALALWQAGLVSYVSGSHHYLLGALALGALPLLGAHAAREGGYRVAAFLLAALALYAALISGARAVYLPLLILLPLALLRLAQEGGWARALGLALGLMGGAALLEAFVPGNAILNALAFKATLTQGEALGEEAKAG
ncbi:MAG: O-antigen ligase domain-containing protein, partial [Meiothermus ruber]|nr:O-antigen ligase domain-containing protein [Meiothermus ruber]